MKNKINLFNFLFIKYRNFATDWFGYFDPEGYAFFLIALEIAFVLISILTSLGIIIDFELIGSSFWYPLLTMLIAYLITYFLLGKPKNRVDLEIKSFQSSFYLDWKGNLIAWLSFLLPFLICILLMILNRFHFHNP